MTANKIWNRMFLTLFSLNTAVNMGFYMTSAAMSKHLVELGMPVPAAGAVIGAMPLAAMLIRPFSGWICDRYRPKSLLALFLLLNALCMAGYGVVQQELPLIALRVLHGLSFGMTTTVAMALAAAYIPAGRMGEGLGYLGLAQTLAVAVGPGVGLALLQLGGGGFMFAVAAACMAVALLLALRLQDPPSSGTAPQRGKPRLALGDFVAREAIMFGIVSFALASANGIESSYIALYGAEFGYANLGWYFTISAAALFGARLICGRLVDSKGLSFVLFPAIACVMASFLLLSWTNAAGAVGIFAAAALIKAIGVGALQPALQAAVIQAATPARRGAATSTFFIGTDLGQATSPVIGGRLIDTGGYPFMFRVYTLPLLAACALYGTVVLWKKKRKRGMDRGTTC